MGLAVSGGSDSMALLRLASRWSSSSGARLSVLTVDHGLRARSAAEAVEVAGWSAAQGLAHATLLWTGAKPTAGLQAKARQARYDLMAGWCAMNGATALLTAHTLDDQAETVLMRLARSSSLDSLAGIPRIGSWNGVKLLRPLLQERREALRGLLREMGQPWIEDPSNGDERFERVRIRRALGLLRELGITAEGLANVAGEAQQATRALWQAARTWVKVHAVCHETGYCRLAAGTFGEETALLRTRILGLLISQYGSGKMPEPAELNLLPEWIEAGTPGRRTLGGALLARRKRELLIGREPGRIDPAPVAVPASGQVVWDRRFVVAAAPGSRVFPALLAGGGARRKDLPAFVQAALPAIAGPDGRTILPFVHGAVSDCARFCRPQPA